MKVYEVLDDAEVLKIDLKTNKGKAVAALVRGAKRKSNNVNVPHIETELSRETETTM